VPGFDEATTLVSARQQAFQPASGASPNGYRDHHARHAHDPLSSPENPEQGGLLSQISTQMVRAMKHYYGKGPISAKSYLIDDLLFIVMREGMTQSEQTMLDAGHETTVRNFRQEFENEMAQRLTDMVEQLTGRRVINYQSQVMFDPNMTVEMFVFDDPAREDQLKETAEAITDPRIGLARSEEVEDATPHERGS
jgi:uncharacterized protein YbcI